MAHINLYDYIALGLDMNGHDATSYVVAKDPEFNQIIDQSIHDTTNLFKWTTPLPKRIEDGGKGYYSDLRKLYAKVKLHFGEFESPWWVIDMENQCIQRVIITEQKQDPLFSDSVWLEWLGANDNSPNFVPKDKDWWKKDKIPGVLYPNNYDTLQGKKINKDDKLYPDIDKDKWAEWYNNKGQDSDFDWRLAIFKHLEGPVYPKWYDPQNPFEPKAIFKHPDGNQSNRRSNQSTVVLNAILREDQDYKGN